MSWSNLFVATPVKHAPDLTDMTDNLSELSNWKQKHRIISNEETNQQTARQ